MKEYLYRVEIKDKGVFTSVLRDNQMINRVGIYNGEYFIEPDDIVVREDLFLLRCDNELY